MEGSPFLSNDHASDLGAILGAQCSGQTWIDLKFAPIEAIGIMPVTGDGRVGLAIGERFKKSDDGESGQVVVEIAHLAGKAQCHYLGGSRKRRDYAHEKTDPLDEQFLTEKGIVEWENPRDRAVTEFFQECTQGHRTKKGTPIPEDAAEKLSSFVQDLKSCHYQVVTTTKKIKLETLNEKGEAQFGTANSYIVIAMPQWSAERLSELNAVIEQWSDREIRSFFPAYLDVVIVTDESGKKKPTTQVTFGSIFNGGCVPVDHPLRKTTDLLCTYNWATIKEGLTHAQKSKPN